MKVAIVFLAALVVVLSSPLPEEPLTNFPLLSEVRDDFGQYAISYLANGASHVEQGALKQINGAVVLVKQGSYAYYDASGKRYQTSYIADENGFRVVGDHIPVLESV